MPINGINTINFQVPPQILPKRTSWTSLPVLGRVIEALIRIFRKIFPCCFREAPPIIPKPIVKIIDTPVTKEFERILGMPKELQNIVVTNLSRKDLDAFDIVLSRSKNKPEWNNLHQIVRQAKAPAILREILADHPSWKSTVDGWKTISIEDKIWLLRVYELHHLPNIQIPQITSFFPGKILHIPSSESPNLLKFKMEIENVLSRIQEVSIYGKKNFKCPDAICLLKNLTRLSIDSCDLKMPPDIRWNANLLNLTLTRNSLKVAPDVSWNPKLLILTLTEDFTIPPNLSRNHSLHELRIVAPLITAPVLSKNEELGMLVISGTKLTSPPDVSKNTQLRYLVLNHNSELTTPPVLRHNSLLEEINLNNNRLSTAPDLQFFPQLNSFSIDNNPIKVLPDFSQSPLLETVSANNCGLNQTPSFKKNPNLRSLYLDSNHLKNLPELNHKLHRIEIRNNPLSDEALRKLPSIVAPRPVVCVF